MYRLMQEMARTSAAMNKAGRWKLAEEAIATPTPTPTSTPESTTTGYSLAEDMKLTSASFGSKGKTVPINLPKNKFWVQSKDGNPVYKSDGSIQYYMQAPSDSSTESVPDMRAVGPSEMLDVISQSDVDIPKTDNELVKPYYTKQQNYRGWKPYVDMVGKDRPFGEYTIDYSRDTAPQWVMTPEGPSLVANIGGKESVVSPFGMAAYAYSNPDFAKSIPYVNEKVLRGAHGLSANGDINRRWYFDGIGGWRQSYVMRDGTEIVPDADGRLFDNKGKQIILGTGHGVTPYSKGGAKWGDEVINAPLQTGRMTTADGRSIAVDLVSGKIIASPEEFRELGKQRGTYNDVEEAPIFTAEVKSGNPEAVTLLGVKAEEIPGTDNVAVTRGIMNTSGVFTPYPDDVTHPTPMAKSDFERQFGAADGGWWVVKRKDLSNLSVQDTNPIRYVKMRESEKGPVYTFIDDSGNEYNCPSNTAGSGAFNGSSYTSGIVSDGKGGFIRREGNFEDGKWSSRVVPLSFNPYGMVQESESDTGDEVEEKDENGYKDPSQNNEMWNLIWHYVKLGIPVGAAVGIVMHLMGGKDSSLFANLLGGAAGGALLGGLGAGTGLLGSASNSQVVEDANGTNVSNSGTGDTDA